MDKRTIFKWIPLVVFVIVCVCLCLYFNGSQADMENNISQKQSELKSLESKVSLAQATTQTKSEQVLADTTGIDQSMVDKDNAAASQLFKLAFTWDSYTSYNKVRNDVKSQYGFADDSEFMQKVLPVVEQHTNYRYEGPKVAGEDVDTSEYMKTEVTDDITDSGLNMTYVSMNSCVADVTTNGYEYLTRVTVSSTSKVGASVSRAFTLGYVVDTNEKLQDIRVYSVGLSSDQ